MRLALAAILLFSTLAGAEESRIALVIGNNTYRDAPLTAPVNDARAMSTSLTDLGFKVTKIENVGRTAMLRAIRTFVEDLKGSEPIGLFYFAGHGMQSRGKNFLIPVDAEVEHEDEIESQGIDVQNILDKFGDVRSGMNILILDACRNNPFAKRGIKSVSGLAAIDGPPGTIVAFAAAPGRVAIEREGGNGIYTKNVLSNIQQPGIPVEEVFKRVRLGVLTDTGKTQVPWENTSLVRDFYFKGAPVGRGFKPANSDSEAEAWASVEGSKNIYDLIGFMRRFPKSRYENEILFRINAILGKLKPTPPQILIDDLPLLLSEVDAGFTMRPINKYIAESRGLTDANGVIVIDVEDGSVAQRARLLPGDILRRINGKPVIGPKDMLERGRTILPGEFVEVVVWRDGKEVSVSGVAQRTSIERMLERIAYQRLLEKNYSRARTIYESLALADDSLGQYNLGIFYLYGSGVERDYKIAESWLLKSANHGRNLAAAYLATIYLSPETGIKNDSDAFKWAKLSADAGVPEGASMLAVTHFRGTGTPRNDVEGVRYAQISAAQGQPIGMYLLGSAFENGSGGLSKNLDEAKTWYRRALGLGHSRAKAALQRLGE
jgi:hypothetical protein